MGEPRLPVVWVCGASGAGKSAAAWGLFEERAAAGRRVAYVDIDQLGMLYPGVGDDPGWHHALKGEALAALVPGYVAAGAQLLVVSGVVDPHEGPGTHLPPNADLTLCLLSPDPAVLRSRVIARGWSQADADEAAAENAVLQAAAFVDVRIETAALSVAETVARLRDVAHVEDRARETRRGELISSSSTGVVLVTGPRAVGSSTVGFGLARDRWRAGRRTGFLDLQQLGFVARDGRTGSESALAVGQLAAMHGLMTERGAELLVVTGHLSVPDRALVRAALPRARVTVVRLRADEPTLVGHVRARVGGSDARLAADDLLGAGPAHQDAVVAAALAEQDVLDSSPADDAVLDVSGRTPAEVVAEVWKVGEGELWHLAEAAHWAEAVRTGTYRRSTRGLALEEVGFVHCSFPDQAAGVAAAFYADAGDVVLLRVDPARVGAEVRVEGGFPHVYGPIPVAAVTAAEPLARDAAGRLVLSG